MSQQTHMADIAVTVIFRTRNGDLNSKICLINGAELCIDLIELCRQALISQHGVEIFEMQKITHEVGR